MEFGILANFYSHVRCFYPKQDGVGTLNGIARLVPSRCFCFWGERRLKTSGLRRVWSHGKAWGRRFTCIQSPLTWKSNQFWLGTSLRQHVNDVIKWRHWICSLKYYHRRCKFNKLYSYFKRCLCLILYSSDQREYIATRTEYRMKKNGNWCS